MKRREFTTLLCTAVASPGVVRAQQPSKLPTIGILGTSTPTAWSLWVPAFTQRIRELGWIEGRTVALEYRWAENRSERAVEIAAEFVRLKADVIVTTGNAVLEARQATSVIPIVFAAANDPVESGLVASLARPGGNVTGLSNQAVDLAGKRLGLLREILPAVRRLGIMANVGYRATALEIDRLQSAARALGVEGTVLEITRAEDIPPAIDALKGRAEALYVIGDSLTTANRVQIGSLAMAKRLPTMSTGREFVEAGALISYGPNFPDLFRRTADYVDKILRGTRPGEIPVEQPTRFDLVLNLKTAKGLDLDVPMHLQQLADGVIE
jgi:putative ABC transport system substrate-binding protein